MNNRDNFVWRPNDNSVTTNLRYNLEAAHWVKAFKSASTNSTASLSEALGVIGMVLSLVVLIIFFIVQIIIEIVNFFATKRFEARERIIVKERIEAQKKAQIEAKERADQIKKQKEIASLKAELIEVTEDMIHNLDVLFKKAASLVVNEQKGSIPILQFDLGIDFVRACKIIDQLESFEIISGFNGKFPRKVLIHNHLKLQLLFERIDEIKNTK